MANSPGLELLFASVQSQLQSENDALVCYIHWNLVHQGFKCIGKGDETPASIKKSEILPPSWNGSQEEYTLHYVPGDSEDKFLLKCLAVEEALFSNFMRMKDEKVTSVSLDVKQFVDKEHLHDFERVYKDLTLLRRILEDDLISPLKKEEKAASAGPSEQSTSASSRRHPGQERDGREMNPLRGEDPLREDDPLRVPHRLPGQRSNPEWGQPVDPFSVGRSDLDPFSGGGSGMLMDPFRSGMPHRGIDPGMGMPGRLPRGAVPPGARFDPIGPPRPMGPGGGPAGGFLGDPDPDHQPPPGYDDMFM
ncbi:proteasome inhibitor PI31 subunit-like [Diadema setosum]|uniref:proteasome inhibitor PI31 subunit-like n=1 Tax=Diadema setosum TaxID=31175 RepID=UPI003B3A33E4